MITVISLWALLVMMQCQVQRQTEEEAQQEEEQHVECRISW